MKSLLDNIIQQQNVNQEMMSATDDVVATRKLTETETSTLRALLKSQLNITGDAQDDEDAGDLLDYAFAMVANGKAVSYVTEEVRKSLSFLAIPPLIIELTYDSFCNTLSVKKHGVRSLHS